MEKVRPLNEKEQRVLKILNEAYDSFGSGCYTFKGIQGMLIGATLEIKEIRKACRSLKRLGYAEFHRGLMSEDGEVAGAGYCISEEGAAVLSPCDICGRRATYEYESEATGKEVLECEEHYKQSPKHDKALV